MSSSIFTDDIDRQRGTFTDDIDRQRSIIDDIENKSVDEPDVNMINIALHNMSLEECNEIKENVKEPVEEKVESVEEKVEPIEEKAKDFIKEKLKIDFTKTDFTSFEKELIRKEINLIKEKYPKYIPIIVRPKDKSIQLSRYKFLVNGEITVGQFMCIIRKKIKNLKSSEALFLIVNNSLAPSSHSLSLVYTQQIDKETNMLFFTLCNENTFGKN